MYSKLFASILDSSVWLEAEHTRLVWLTLLAAKDEDGFARFATVENLAGRARLSVAKVGEAVRILEAPDIRSSNPDHDGRRIERVPGGWLVLNAKLYDDIGKRAHEREQTRERVRRHRAKSRDPEPDTVIEDTRRNEMAAVASDLELGLIAQYGALWESVALFLEQREQRTRPAWIKEISTLTIAYGPEITAQACNDAAAADDPVRVPAGLRAFAARVKEAKTRPPTKRDDGSAILAFGQIQKLATSRQQPGQAAVRFIPRQDIAALGPRVLAAYDAIGGAERILGAAGDKMGLVLRDFTNAYEAHHDE